MVLIGALTLQFHGLAMAQDARDVIGSMSVNAALEKYKKSDRSAESMVLARAARLKNLQCKEDARDKYAVGSEGRKLAYDRCDVELREALSER